MKRTNLKNKDEDTNQTNITDKEKKEKIIEIQMKMY